MTQQGQTAPFGFFDPLGLSKSVSDEDLKRWRESELKHGRYTITLFEPTPHLSLTLVISPNHHS